jgi:hypothetical protein
MKSEGKKVKSEMTPYLVFLFLLLIVLLCCCCVLHLHILPQLLIIFFCCSPPLPPLLLPLSQPRPLAVRLLGMLALLLLLLPPAWRVLITAACLRVFYSIFFL